MPYIMKNGTAYAGNAVTLTQAQYDALSDLEKHNGTVYYIYDSDNVITTDDVEYDNGSSKMPLSQVIYWIFVGQQETNNNVTQLSNHVSNLDNGIAGQVVFSNGYSASSDAPVSLVKHGQLCVLNGNVYPTSESLASNTWTTFMTLPTGFIPNLTRSFDACIYGGGNKYITTVRCEIASNGNVSFFRSSSVAISEAVKRISVNVAYETVV